jgi:hypothetical protein
MKTNFPDDYVPLRKLTITFLVTTFCSQLVIAGLYVVFVAMWGTGDFMDGTPQPKSPPQIALLFVLWVIAFTVLGAGPILLSEYFKPGWRSFWNGVLSFVGMTVCFCVGWSIKNVLLPDLAFVPYEISAGIAITVLLVMGGKVKSRSDIIGLILAIVLGLALAAGFRWIKQDLYLISMNLAAPFLWIWLSAVFFPNLLNRRTDWRGGLVYILMMIIATWVLC